MSSLQERLANLPPEKRAWVLKQLRQQAAVASNGSESMIALGPRGQEIPLSFAQQRLWFIDQMEGPAATYNIFDGWLLEGNLNLAAFSESVAEIVRRHESLRTTFATNNGQPLQVIHPPEFVSLELLDLQAVPAVEQPAQVQHLAREEAKYCFDLASGPLTRVRLLRTAFDTHYLLLNVHHIIFDGWSLNLFIKELVTLYHAYVHAKSSPLPSLPIQYGDFAHWQRSPRKAEVLSSQLNYWKERIAGAPPLLELPTDHPRPIVQSFRGASHLFTLSKTLTEELKSFARQAKTTLFIVLQAAFAVLLHRYSSQEELLLGIPIANRNHPEIESLIGFFANTLVMRFRLSGDPTFGELLSQVHEDSLEAYKHQELAFEQLVEALQPERAMTHHPLFQVAFSWEHAVSDRPKLFGLQVSRLNVEKVVSKFDLTLFMQEVEQRVEGEWEYCTDLFESATIQRLTAHWQTLLQSIVALPLVANQAISKLTLLTEAERHQLLVEWNDTVTDYPRDKGIHTLFEEQVERTPDAIALVHEGQQLTYRELNQRANQLANYLIGQDSCAEGHEMLVGICVERSLEMVVGLLGILKAGGAYVPLDPAYPQARLAFMLSDTAAPIILTQEKVRPNLPAEGHIFCLDTEWDACASQSEHNLANRASADHLAYIMYTSGSTGKPKGVSVIHRNVVRLVKNTNFANLSVETTFLQLAPISFDAATLEIWGPLLNGGKLVIMPSQLSSLAELGQAIRQHHVTTLWLTAGLFHAMVDEQLEALRPLRQLLAGGDVLSVSHVQKVLRALPDIQLINGYGPTENTTFTCCYPFPAESRITGSAPIGRPIANTQVYILDRYHELVPVGVRGELYTGGDGVARGYHNRPELTKMRFINNPFGEGKLYKTGDLCRYLPDSSGNIEFLGRIDSQVKVRGFRIELGEIEAVLNQHPMVRETIVVVRESATGKQIVAYLVASEAVTGLTMQSYLATKLPDYMIPAAFVQLDAIPLTPNGKIDRRALPAPKREGISENHQSEGMPVTSAERQIAALWQEVLQVENVGIHDNFFDLGGHSLLVVQIHGRLQELIGQEIPIRALFRYPTVHALAQHLSQQKQSHTKSDLAVGEKRAHARHVRKGQAKERRKHRKALRKRR